MAGSDEVPRYSKEEIGEKLHELDKELKMTTKEKDRLAECFKDKEFMGMFHEYMQEISDPKNRQEYNDYIRQCEAGGDTAGKIPEGMQLILPKVGFCLKATSVKKGKAFVNITHTEKLKEFSCARVPGQGENWSMPFCLDNPKPDTDSENKPVIVYTIAFNTAGYMQFTREPKRREFLIAVALENIELSFKDDFEKAGPEDALCRFTYKEMKNLKFKGLDGKPTVLSCKKEDMNMKEATSEGTFGHEGVKPMQPPTKGPAKKQKGKKKQKNGKKKSDPSPLKGFLDKPKKNKNGLIQELDSADEEEEGDEEEEPETGVCKPKYSVVHRGQFEMQNHMMGESAQGAQIESCRPRELIVKIQLPRCESARDVDLDVSSERLALQVEGKYDLVIDLPYPVDEENGAAKFDKTLRVMMVTLPVVKEQVPEQPGREVPAELPDEDALPAELAALLDDGDGVLVEVGDADGGAGFTCTDDLIVNGIAPDSASDRAGVTRGMTLVAFEAGSHSWNVWQQAGGTMTWDEMYRIVANAARPWRFTFAPPDADGQAADPVDEDSLGIDAADMVAGFYACTAFAGYKDRYFFGTGEQGLGYYRDVGHLRNGSGGGTIGGAVGRSTADVAAAPTPLDVATPAPEPESDAASSPIGGSGLGGFENSIMLELD